MTEQAKLARINWSTLKHIETSPKALQYRVEHPTPETPAMRMGTAIHCAVLEPDKFGATYITTDECAAIKKDKTKCTFAGSLYYAGAWYCGTKGHAPEGAGAVPEGKRIVTAAELVIVETCADAVMSHPVASKYVTGGQAEQEIEWEDEEIGMACRGRVDYLMPSELSDLKSTRQETVEGFKRDASRALYHGQLAWYHDGAKRAKKLPESARLPLIIAASTAEPYDVMAFRLPATTYKAGQAVYRAMLRKYLNCMNADWWPGVAPDLLELDLPNWAPGMSGDNEGNDGGAW